MKPASEKMNGKSETLPEGWNQWPGINDAARRLSVPHTRIKSWASEGALKWCMDPDGRPRYDPKGLEELSAYLETGVEKQASPGISHDEFRAGTELVKQVLGHQERMVPLLASAMRDLNEGAKLQRDAYQAEILSLRERIKTLENERDAQAEASRKIIADEHAQRLAEKQIDASERRKDKAQSAFTDRLLPLLAKKFGLDSDPRAGIAMQLIHTLKREQIMLLLMIPDGLAPAQRELVLKLLGELSPEEKQALGMADGEPAVT